MIARALWRGAVWVALVALLAAGTMRGVRWWLDAQQVAALASQVDQLRRQGKHHEALAMAQRYVGLAGTIYGEEHPQFALAALWLGVVHRDQGRFADAEPLFRRALEIYEKALGPDHLDTVAALDHLAQVYRAQGHYAMAEPLYTRGLALADKMSDPDPFHVGTMLDGLADICHKQGRYLEAETLYKRSLAVWQKALGAHHPYVAAALDNLAQLYHNQGRYTDAEPFYQRSLAIWERAPADSQSQVAALLNSLAALYEDQGRYADAEPLIRRALDVYEKVHGPGHPDTATTLSHLGHVYQAQGRYADAEPMLTRALAITEKVRGPDHVEVGIMLDSLAELYREQGRYPEAEALCKRSLPILQKALGADHPQAAASLNRLALLRFVQEQWAEAADYWRQATELTLRRSSRGADSPLSRLAKRRVRGEGYPFLGLVKASHRIAAQSPDLVLQIATEMFVAAQRARSSRTSALLAQLATGAARGNATLSRLLRERQSLLGERQGTEQFLVAALSRPFERRNNGIGIELDARIADINARIADIDHVLGKDFPDYVDLADPKPLAVNEVQALLAEDEVLVLFLDTVNWPPTPEETFVWAITRRDMRWARIELGTGALSQRVAGLRCGLDRSAWESNGKQRCADLLSIAVERAPQGDELLPFDLVQAHELYQGLFGQIEDVVKGKTLLVVPSGPLTALPFHVLVTRKPAVALPTEPALYADAQWLAKHHAVAVLPSVASLKRFRQFGKASTETRPFVGFGNPLLAGPTGSDLRAWKQQSCAPNVPTLVRSAGLAARSGISSFFTSGGLASLAEVRAQHPLPQTAEELCAVAKLAGAAPSAVYLGTNATETKVKALSSSGALAGTRLLHFATHGLVAGETMMLSANKAEPALILTPPDKATEEDDGLLTASEIAQLKLEADWTLLSACNTGAGGSNNRLGAPAFAILARAFFHAGVRTVLMSHWLPTTDASVRLVEGTFAAMQINPKGGRIQALQWSMLALMNSGGDDAHPTAWAPFMMIGADTS